MPAIEPRVSPAGDRDGLRLVVPARRAEGLIAHALPSRPFASFVAFQRATATVSSRTGPVRQPHALHSTRNGKRAPSSDLFTSPPCLPQDGHGFRSELVIRRPDLVRA